MENLVVLKQKPKIPEEWDYEKSVSKVKQQIYKWKNLTKEIATELWIAKQVLKDPGRRTDLDAKASRLPTWSEYCKDIGSDRRIVDKWLQTWFGPEKEIEEEIPALPPGKFKVIYADPPWRYEFSRSNSRAVESHYPTLDLDKLCDMKIPAADDAVLFLWVPVPKKREGLKVMEAWGFEYKTGMVWVKDKIGMGYYVRGQHELVFIGTKGELPVPLPENRPSSVIDARRGKHSHKPDIYEIIEKMYPDGKYLELFATCHRDKWVCWGDAVQKEKES